MINVAVERNGSENNASLIRRFTRKVQGAELLPRARSRRYHERPKSEALRKKRTLRRIDRRERNRELYKLGKLTPSSPRRR